MSNLVPTPDEPDGDAVIEDVERLLRHFAGDDLTQQDAVRALGMWKNNRSLTADERTAILKRFAPDPGQAKLVDLLGSYQQTEDGAP